MLVTMGDLVDDVVVELGGPINVASDTDARITHRRGGSAANVAVAAARLGRARFVGQVGTDEVGERLVADLVLAGVDTTHVVRDGVTATIVVLVDETGERSMLVDRGSARHLVGGDVSWLDDAHVLHLTLYSLLDEPIATTSRRLAALAGSLGVPVSVDVSSVALIESVGAPVVLDMIRALDATLVFANADEAAVLGIDGPIGDASVIVKRGAAPCTLHRPGVPALDVPVPELGRVSDTTGAGDAFAAGVLMSEHWHDDLVAACRAGHAAAASLLTTRPARR